MSRIFNFLLAACVVAFSVFGQTPFKGVTVNTNTGIFGAGALGSGVKLTLNNGVVSNSTVRDSILTNVSIFGPSITIDTGNELQDTVDYSLALTPNGNTSTENDASPRPRSVATIASLVSDVDPLLVPTYARISVLGYYAAGDGGGGDFRRVLASSGSTNSGTFFASTANATYAWERLLLSDAALTPQMFGAVANDGSDDSAAIDAMLAYAKATKFRAMSIPAGIYQFTNTITLDNRLRLVGAISTIPATNGAIFSFTGTNAPIVTISGAFNTLENVLLMYATQQPSTATSSGALTFAAGQYFNTARNVATRNGAYGVYQASSDGYQTRMENIYVGNASISLFKFLANGTQNTLNNIYLQNISSVSTPTATVTSGSRVGAVVTLTLDAVPALLTTNRFVAVTGVTPSDYNGTFVVTAISGNQITYTDTADPGAWVSGGTVTFYAQSCTEAPFQLGFGEYDIQSLDVEHVVTSATSICLLQGAINNITSLHIEQCYGTASTLALVYNGYKSPQIGSYAAVNLGAYPGQTLYSFYQGYAPGGGRMEIGSAVSRDHAVTGATWYLGGRASASYEKVLIGSHDGDGTSRVNATGTPTDMGSVEMKLGIRRTLTGSSGTDVGVTLPVTVNQSGTAGYAGVIVDVTESTTGSGTKNLQQWRIGGTTRAKIDNKGVFTYTIPSSLGGTDFTLESDATNESEVRFQIGAALDRRLSLGGNYIQASYNTTGAAANLSLNPSGGSVVITGTIELGHATDTTLARSAAGVVTIEGVTVAERPTTTALTYSGTNVTLTATSQVLHGNTLTLTNNCLLTITSSDGASGGITIVPHASTSYTVYLDSAIKLLGGGSSFVVTNSASETVNLEWKQTLRGGSSVVLANKAVYP